MLKFGVYEVCCYFLQSSVSSLYEKHNNAMQCDVGELRQLLTSDQSL